MFTMNPTPLSAINVSNIDAPGKAQMIPESMGLRCSADGVPVRSVRFG
jgi:hypothetical protein